jgi:phosphate transport system permease protein
MNIYFRRRCLNAFNLGMSVFATAFGFFWLVWIMWTLLSRGLPYLHLSTFVQNTPPPGEAGGLANALIGTLMLTVLGVVIGAPAGILAGTYLAEFARDSRLAVTVRFVNDVLLSAPSIIVGVFVYALIVRTSGHFSGWAGATALAIIVFPVVVRTTENMLRLVPDNLREAAAALGVPQWKVVLAIVYRASIGGIMTGVILAIARIAGETAPLLFTALNNQFWSTNMNAPIANLPVVIFQFAMSPYEDWQHLAWAGALIITVSILGLNILARTIISSRYSEN